MSRTFTKQHVVIDDKDYIEITETREDGLLNWARFGPLDAEAMLEVEAEPRRSVLREWLSLMYGGEFGVIFPAEKQKPVYGTPMLFGRETVFSENIRKVENWLKAPAFKPLSEIMIKPDSEKVADENFPRDENVKEVNDENG